jgi:DNA-binding transcriptional regulator YbjK
VRSKAQRTAAPEPAQVAKEHALLDATLRLLGRGGLAAVTHRAVAVEAGVSLGVVTYRYPTIDLLLASALEHLCEVDLEDLTALADELQTRAFDPEAWAAAFAKTIAGNIRKEREREIAGFELMLAGARHAPLRRACRKTDEAYRRLAELVLRAAGSRDPERHARILVAAILGLELKHLSDPRPHFEDELAAALRELVSGLVGAC